MNNSEFETRAFANPDDDTQDFLDALAALPERQQVLDDIRSFNERLGSIANSVAAPTALSARLKDCATEEASASDPSSRPATGAADNLIRLPAWRRPARLAAMAAALVLAVGLTYSSRFSSNQPSAAEMAFGQQVINHVYMELDEINASTGASLQQVNQAVGPLGGALNGNEAMDRMAVSFAKPCLILPRNNSAHLVVTGSRGDVNIIIIDNSPVRKEFSFSDDRFEAVVVPLDRGNLILVGEKNEPLADYQQIVDDNLVWRI